MPVNSITRLRSAEAEPVRLSWWRARVVERRQRRIQAEENVSEAKLSALATVGSRALERMTAASVQEQRVVQTCPENVDRAQFLVDRVTHELGAVIELLSERLKRI